MAIKTTQKKRAKKAGLKRKTLLPKQVGFNVPTILIVAVTLSVVGYFVIRSFAAGGFYRAKGTCSTVSTFAGYSCYFDSADGLAARMYITLLNRTPTAASTDGWAARIVSTGSPAAVAQQMVSTAEGQKTFLSLSQGSRVNRMFLSLLNRGPVAADGPGNWSASFKENANVGTAWYYFVTNYRNESISSNWLKDKMVQAAPTLTSPPTPPPAQPPTQPPEDPPETPLPPESPSPNPSPEPSDPPQSPEPVTPPGQDDSYTGGQDDYYDPYVGYAVSQDDGDSEALLSLGEVSLEDLEGASDEKIQEIIEESITKSNTSAKTEVINRTFAGKLKLLPPGQAMSDGPDQMYYYINGKLKAKVKKSPFSYTLDTTRLKNARYALTIVPYQNGEKLGEYTYGITIKNNLNFWQKIYNIITAPFAG